MIDIRQDLPEVFENFKENRRNSFLKVKELKDKNTPVIGVFCTFFPQEFGIAVGASTVSLCSTSDETIVDAERDLPVNLCPLIKSSYGFAITDKCPFFYFSDLIIGETTCDGKKKMYEYLGEFKNVYVMELPNKKTPDSLNLWKTEIYKLKNSLEEQFNVKITNQKLRESTKIKNEERSAIKDFYSIMKSDDIPLMGLDLWHVLNGVKFEFDKRKIPTMLKDLKTKILSEDEHKHITDKKRILITGCPIGGATEKIITSVENNGGVVVCYENCGGAKAIDENVDLQNPDIYTAIAEKYLNIACACITPNDNRLKLLNRLINEYKVDGVIDMHLQTCTPYEVESLRIKRFTQKIKQNSYITPETNHSKNTEPEKQKTFILNGKQIPYISVGTDYSKSDIGQLNTRIQAFLEMI